MVRLWHFQIAFALFWLVSTSSADVGVPFVRRHAPALVDAATEVLGEARAREFFAGWGTAELDQYERSLEILRDRLARVGGDPLLYKIWNENAPRYLFWNFGEVLGSAHLKKEFKAAVPRASRAEASAFFMTESEYRRLNAGPRPDGLVYRLERAGAKGEPRLTLLKVLESKVGSAYHKTSQSRGYFTRWRKQGITLRESLHVSPTRIFLELPGEDDLIALPKARYPTLEKILFVVQTQGGAGDPKVYRPPFEENELREIARRAVGSGIEIPHECSALGALGEALGEK